MKYYCMVCKMEFDEQRDFCPNPKCGSSQVARVVDSTGVLMKASGPARQEGPHHMGVFVFDFSGSMYWGLDGSTGAPVGKRRIDVVANAFAANITSMRSYKAAGDVRIALVGFAGSAKVLSQWWLPDLGAMTEEQLRRVVLDQCSGDQWTGGTNLGAGLMEAARLMQEAINGHGEVKLLSEAVRFGEGRKLRAMVPNIRAFIYSDGEHNAGPFRSPFEDFVLAPEFRQSHQRVSGLMTMSLGVSTAKGEKDMEALAGHCPVHDQPGFFAVRTDEDAAVLRQVFHTVSRGSGFCRKCA